MHYLIRMIRAVDGTPPSACSPNPHRSSHGRPGQACQQKAKAQARRGNGARSGAADHETTGHPSDAKLEEPLTLIEGVGNRGKSPQGNPNPLRGIIAGQQELLAVAHDIRPAQESRTMTPEEIRWR